MNDVQNCAARALREWTRDMNLVVLTSEDDFEHTRNAIGVSLPDVPGVGGSWDTGEAQVILRKFGDKPDGEQGRLVICTGGKALSTKDSKGLRRWREATASV